jgi:hypothetical protein
MSSAMTVLVRIKPTTDEHLESVYKYGGLYWMREVYAGMARLIPVRG